MNYTYFGHSCFLVEISDKKLLFDPFITPNELAKHIDISTIQADYIFISHGHEDHIADAVTLANQTGATIITNYEIYLWLMKKGLSNIHPLGIGGKWKFDFGVVRMTSAIHSSVLPDGTYGGTPAGFVIEAQEGSFYYAGDTGLTKDMKLIGDEYDLDFAVLPIGDNFTMGVDDAVICADYIECEQIVGVHYDTFGYIVVDHDLAKKKFKSAGLKLHLPGIGDTISL